MASVALRRPDDRTSALRETMSELFSMDEPRKRVAAMISGLGIHYDLGEGHPLLGRRMPDLDLITAVSHDLPVKLVVFDNGRLGMVKLEMEQVGLPEFGTDRKSVV